MIFSGSSYSELPISSTRYMYLTYNGSKRKIILTTKPTVAIQLNTIEFRQSSTIYSIELNINQQVEDITL